MLLFLDHGPVREIRLNRPPANAFSLELIVALREAVESAPHNGSRALLLSGTPGRFSGGLDVPLLLSYDRPTIGKLWHEFYALLKALASSPIPIAAAITGHAPAGGTVLPLFCSASPEVVAIMVAPLSDTVPAPPLPSSSRSVKAGLPFSPVSVS